jgi:hypothetical protein
MNPILAYSLLICDESISITDSIEKGAIYCALTCIEIDLLVGAALAGWLTAITLTLAMFITWLFCLFLQSA